MGPRKSVRPSHVAQRAVVRRTGSAQAGNEWTLGALAGLGFFEGATRSWETDPGRFIQMRVNGVRRGAWQVVRLTPSGSCSVFTESSPPTGFGTGANLTRIVGEGFVEVFSEPAVVSILRELFMTPSQQPVTGTTGTVGSSNPWVNRVFVMDDHPFFAQALASLLATEADLSVCGVASRADDFLAKLPLANADVLVMDVNMSSRDNWSLVVAVRRLSVHVPILFVSSLQNPRLEGSQRWMEPCGFMEKNRDPGEMVKAVRQVLARARQVLTATQSVPPFPRS